MYDELALPITMITWLVISVLMSIASALHRIDLFIIVGIADIVWMLASAIYFFRPYTFLNEGENAGGDEHELS